MQSNATNENQAKYKSIYEINSLPCSRTIFNCKFQKNMPFNPKPRSNFPMSEILKINKTKYCILNVLVTIVINSTNSENKDV